MAPSLVQSQSGTITSGTTLTITLGSNTTAGNCLVVYVGEVQGTTNPVVSGITLGGAAGNFAAAATAINNADSNVEEWVDWNIPAGQTSVVISFTAGTGVSQGNVAWVEEWSGILATSNPVDRHPAGVNGASTAPSSASSGTLTQASELVTGAICTGTSPITGPGAPWTNQAELDAGAASLIAGHQVVSATTAQTYSGSTSASSGWGAVIVTLKAAPPRGGAVSALQHGRPAAVKGKVASIFVATPRVGGPAAKFFPPHALFRGAAAAVKGKLTGARGGAGRPSPFRQPGPLHGQPAAVKGKLTGLRGRPGVPAPFTPPARLAPPPAYARPGRLTGARGRPGVPAPFTAPRSPLHGQPAARKGALAGIIAPPPVIQPNVPAPFFAPHTLLRGQAGVMARTRTAYTAAPPPAPPPSPLAAWQGATHIVAADAFGNLIQGARHTGKGGPGQDLKGDYQRSGD